MEPNLKEKISNECARIEEDSEHSFKSHYNAAVFWGKVNLILGLPAALLGAVAGGTSAIDGSPAMVTSSAFLATALITCVTFLKPSEKSDSHKNAGHLYQSLRNQTRLFRELELDEALPDEEARKKLVVLSNRRDELNASMPSIPRKAYEKAKQDIDDGRSEYKIDKES